MQSGSKVLLQNGELKYNADGSAVNAVAYNTITTPKGRQFQMTLPDGTRVWLNAGSSLRFPTVFVGNERKVEVTGEGYFEVAKNAAKPFRVSINNETEIEVLGTHFNVNSYSNETSIKTTLLEGSVRVKTQVAGKKSEVIIAPGQQAQLTAGNLKVANNVDLSEVMAWKNGVFNFHNATLEEVMRELERWYDINVVYEKGVPQIEFVGKMGRDLSLAKVLRGLEMSEVHFRLEGRTLIVMP
jgi:ferric-dicitrate binding protein FerR (iron transport regulator)